MRELNLPSPRWMGKETNAALGSRGARLTDEAVIARHLLPLSAGLNRVTQVESLMSFELANGGKRRELLVDLLRRLRLIPSLSSLVGLFVDVGLEGDGEGAIGSVLLDIAPRSLPR